MRRAVLLGLLVAAIVGGGLVTWSLTRGAPPKSQGVLETLEVHGEVPDFTLIERSGRRVTRPDLLEHVWVANFIYTQCKETCPLQSAQMARLQSEFSGEEDLRLVSISVDPVHDTPEVLSRYAEQFLADPLRWLFLTGEKREIYMLAKEGFRLGVVDPDDQVETGKLSQQFLPRPAVATHGSQGIVIHSSRFVLVDRRARIRAYHLPDDEDSLARLRENLKILLRER